MFGLRHPAIAPLLLFVGVLLISISWAKASTVAYWRFEEGPADANVTHGGQAAGVFYPGVMDSSGNGNALSVWAEGWAGYAYRTDLPATVIPLTGAANNFSVQNTGSYPVMFTQTGSAMQTISPAAFTIEVSFKPETGGYRTLVGRDSQGATTLDANLSALYLQITPGDAVAIKFCDVSGYWHEAISAGGIVGGFTYPNSAAGHWYHLAAVSDGSILSLYLNSGTGFNLVAQTDMTASGSPNTALTAGLGDGSDWDPGNWTVGRGLYAGNHTDRAYGFIDEVRISDTALPPSQFLFAGVTLTVTNLADSGPGTLRAALASAANGDTISCTVTGTITLTSGQLNVTNSVAIIGPGPGVLTISGNNASRVFNVTGANVKISGLRIANGRAALNGTGIYAAGSPGSMISVNNCVLTNNSSTTNGLYGGGGGIYNNSGVTLTVSNCTLAGNSATLDGGGIYNYRGVLSVVASTLSSNWAYYGGGIFNDGMYSSSATLTVNASTFSGNHASTGGGIDNAGYSGSATVTVNASTFSGNWATNNGGILYNSGLSGNAQVTIGDTILNANTTGTNLYSTYGTVISAGYNLSSDDASGYLTNGTDRVGINPLLGPLQNNGGPTFTHALLPSSPALDRGKTNAVPALARLTDQRGFTRPVEVAAIPNAAGGDGSDIGAYEAQTLAVTNTADSGPGTLRAILASAASGDIITFSVTNTITLTSGQLLVPHSVTILGPGAGVLTVSGNHASRVFDITGANVAIRGLRIADGQGATVDGAGIRADGSSGCVVLISDCVITNNRALGNFGGGGIFNNPGVALTISNCTITGNCAPNGWGGGIHNLSGALTVVDSTVSSNSASSIWGGGGIYNNGGSGNATLTINGSTVSSNSAAIGGGIDNDGESGMATLIIDHCTISSNSANSLTGSGGGIFNDGYYGNATLIISASTINGNSASVGGGIENDGMYYGDALLSVDACTLAGNAATYGGGIANWGQNHGAAQAYVNASTFSGNTATAGLGGGIINDGEVGAAALSVGSSTFCGGLAAYGGGIYNDGYSGAALLEIGDTLLTGATGGNLYNFNNAGTVVSRGYNLSSDAAGGDGTKGPGGLLNATGDIRNTDPKLGPLQANGGPTFTHALLADSPAIDKGKTNAVPALPSNTDQRGLARSADFFTIPNAAGGDGSDIGAFEFQNNQPTTVTSTNDSGPGTLREALASAASGDTVDATGVSGTITLTTDQLHVPDGVTILGPGHGALTVTAINGIRVFLAVGTYVTISGLTIANAQGDGYGMAVLTGLGSSVTLDNCVVTSNHTTLSGGGIFNSAGGRLTISNCIVRGNSAAGPGGGVYNNQGVVTVVGSTLNDNSAGLNGGGLYNDGSSGGSAAMTISNCTVSGNTASQCAGGVFNNGESGGSATVTITTSTFSSNSAPYGGVIFNDGGGGSATVTLNTSTFSGNSAGGGGGIANGGAWEGSSVTLTISACTFSGNSAGDGGISNDGRFGGSAKLQIGDTILNAGASGSNIFNWEGLVKSDGYNLSSDDGGGFLAATGDQTNTAPLLGPLQDNGGPTWTHALLPGSPAIDQGKRDAVTNLVSNIDQRGFTRPVDNPRLTNAPDGDGSDIGAIEAQSYIVTSTNDTGIGSLREVLAGAANGDTVSFAVAGTITLTNGQLEVARSLDILGPGAGTLTVSGNNASRVFNVTGSSVTIHGLTITEGQSALNGAGLNAGGGFGTVLTVVGCVLTNNRSTLNGGGIFTGSGVTMTLSNCTVSGNGTSQSGGGLFNSNGTVTVVACTFSRNSANFVGGGIMNFGQPGSAVLQMLTCTFSTNSATSGGGVCNYGQSGSASLTINACTFSGNWAASGYGGGIQNNGDAGIGTVDIGDTILSAGLLGANFYNYNGTVTSHGFNLCSDYGSAFLNAAGDQIHTDPKLGPLQDNGGPTWTHALLPGSPALDKGKRDAVTNLTCSTDQRGLARLVDNPWLADASGGDGSDIGAFEFQGTGGYDTDADGLPDFWELACFGNLSQSGTDDFDHDGQNNLFEYLAGTDPADPTSVFNLRMESVPGQPNQRNLIFKPWAAGRSYTPESTTNLAQPFVLLTGHSVSTNGAEVIITDLNATTQQKFYRIKITLP